MRLKVFIDQKWKENNEIMRSVKFIIVEEQAFFHVLALSFAIEQTYALSYHMKDWNTNYEIERFSYSKRMEILTSHDELSYDKNQG